MEMKPTVSNENLFFFTDQEYFSTTRFEYLSQKALSKGFIFGLFEPELSLSNQSFKDIEGNTYLNTYNSEQTNLNPLKHINEL